MPRRDRPPILTIPFALLVGAHFLHSLGFSSLILLPLYLDHLGADRATVGGVMGIAAVGGLIARPVVGAALDRVGRKTTLAVGTFALVAGLVGIGAPEAVGPGIYGAMVLVGIGTATGFTGYFTLASDLVPAARRTEGIALFGISGMLPLTINPAAGAIGVEGADLRWFFPLIGAAVAASLPFLAAVRAPRPAPAGPAPKPNAKPPAHVLVSLSQRPLWPVWLATVVFAGLVAIFMAFATVIAADRGVGNPGIIWLTYAAGAVTVRVFGAWIPGRIGPSRMVPPALLSYATAGVLVALTASPSGFAAAGLFAGFGHGYCFPILTAQTVARVPDRVRGSALSLFTALWDLVKLSLVPAAGALADATDDRTMMIAVVAGALAGLVGWGALEAGTIVPEADPVGR